jgi:hypothetical protein
MAMDVATGGRLDHSSGREILKQAIRSGREELVVSYLHAAAWGLAQRRKAKARAVS